MAYRRVVSYESLEYILLSMVLRSAPKQLNIIWCTVYFTLLVTAIDIMNVN